MSDSPTTRFSNRIPYYHQYRPRYPQDIVETLRDTIGLTPEWAIADIGSGTGISSDLFLKHGNTVYGIEPNDDMRAESVKHLDFYPNFTAIKGQADATGLSDESVHLVIAGQAFHWFDAGGAKQEFTRILKPGGQVALFWNTRVEAASSFMTGFDALVKRYSLDYEKVNAGCVINAEDEERNLKYFFREYQRRAFPNEQVLDAAGVRGRLLSASYTPLEDHPNHVPMLAELQSLFDANQSDGTVTIPYITELFWGMI
jgi:SAM-dependent methyltransferase